MVLATSDVFLQHHQVIAVRRPALDPIEVSVVSLAWALYQASEVLLPGVALRLQWVHPAETELPWPLTLETTPSALLI